MNEDIDKNNEERKSKASNFTSIGSLLLITIFAFLVLKQLEASQVNQSGTDDIISDNEVNNNSDFKPFFNGREDYPLVDDRIFSDQKKRDNYIQTLDISEKSLAFSRIAEVGKVSLFIISAHWCKPCEVLKNQLIKELEVGNINPEYVDIYYCLVTKNASEGISDLEQRQAYRHLRDIDGLVEVFPTTYIVAPTTNCFTFIQGAGPSSLDKIISYSKDLSELAKNDFDPEYLVLEPK